MWHSHTSLRCCYFEAVAPRFLASFHGACVVAVQALVLPGPARLDISLGTGPWAMLPRSFSYHPPTSLGCHGWRFVYVYTIWHVLISDPRRGRYMGLLAFIPPPPPPQFCLRHISGTVTRTDSKLSVLLGPAV